MRNLKKILALVLALVMSLSLMATASAAGTAAATDAATAYKTAVDVLTGLKVVIGDAGGIRENDPITRAEAATLIYRVHTADVTDSKVYLHTDHPFTDVASTSWMNSYVSYAHNAQIVKGKTTTTFDPTANITGYETLAMTLRALGYGKNGEFEGSEWKIQTAAWSQRIGLFSGISAADSTDYALNQPASRGFVFQVMFNAVLMDQVAYSAYTPDGYSSIGKSMADGLKLTKVEGVVMANEYADLESSSTLSANKTRLVNADGSKYTVNYSTGLDDIGESRLVYVHDGKEVLSIADSGKNNTAERTTKETNLNSILDEAGISNSSDAARYLNFDFSVEYTTDYRIRYVLNCTNGYVNGTTALLTDVRSVMVTDHGSSNVNWTPSGAGTGTLSCTIKPDSVVTPADISWMQFIFANGDLFSDGNVDYTAGAIYVNTQSTTDISDDPDYSYELFKDKFLNLVENATPVSANENGNWLKVIDNDNDGVVDYIFKVVYTAAQVSRIKDDVITLDVKDRSLNEGNWTDVKTDGNDLINTLTTQEVADESGDLETGDVVYYAIIDGVARAYKAEVRTATIDKMNRNERYAVTNDGDTWYESGVHEHIVDSAYESGVAGLNGHTSYDLYFDRNDTLMAYAVTDLTSDFVLVTDGWFMSAKNGNEYAIRYYDDETKKIEQVDIASGGDLFIGRDVNYYDSKGTLRTTDNNDWMALKYLGGVLETSASGEGALDNSPVAALNGSTGLTKNVVRTAVAVLRDGDTLLPVEEASARREYVMIDMAKNAIPTNSSNKGDIYNTDSKSDTAYNELTDTDVEVIGTGSTIYYVVYPTSATTLGVKAYTGYSSVKTINGLVGGDVKIEDVYAVATRNERDNNLGGDGVYYTADVVVVELTAAPDNSAELVLLVDDVSNLNDVDYRRVRVVRSNGADDEVTVYVGRQTKSLDNERYTWASRDAKIEPGMYWIQDTGSEDADGETIYNLYEASQNEIRDANIVVGQMRYQDAIYENDFVTMYPTYLDGVVKYDADDAFDWQAYTITENSKLYQLSYDNAGGSAYNRQAASLVEEEAQYVLNGGVEWVQDVNNRDAAAVYYAERPLTNQAAHAQIGNDTWSYFYNDVVICYSGSSIVWAVSFRNAQPSDDTKLDYAQAIWASANIQPSAPAASVPDTYTVTLKPTEGSQGELAKAIKTLKVDGTEVAVTYDEEADTLSFKVPQGKLSYLLNITTNAGYEMTVLDVSGSTTTIYVETSLSGDGANKTATLNIVGKGTMDVTFTYDGEQADLIARFEAALAAARATVEEYWDSLDEETEQNNQTVINKKTALDTFLNDLSVSEDNITKLNSITEQTEYTNLTDAVDGVEETLPDAKDGIVTLTCNITLDDIIELESGTTEINLNGHDITFTGFESGSAITVDSGKEVTITGEGTISIDTAAEDLNGLTNVIAVEGTGKLTVGANVTLEVTKDAINGVHNTNAIAVTKNSAGAVVDVYGTVIGGAGINMSGNTSATGITVTVYPGAVVEGGGWAIYDGGDDNNVLNVLGGTITGGSGGINVNGGTANITGGTIGIGNNATVGTRPEGGGSYASGAAIAVTPYTGRDTIVTIGENVKLEGTWKLGLNVLDNTAFDTETVRVTYPKTVVGTSLTYFNNDPDIWPATYSEATGLVVITRADLTPAA